jgi:hypothetical protein
VTPIVNVLTQYGAVGLIAVIAVMVARALFQKSNLDHDQEIVRLTKMLADADARTAKESARADRVTEELSRLSEVVRNEYVNTLARTSQALADTTRDVNAARSANTRRR